MAHRILFADDEGTLRSIAARALRFKEYEVVEASDGFEAWGLECRGAWPRCSNRSRLTT
jgi:hypothetical protein